MGGRNTYHADPLAIFGDENAHETGDNGRDADDVQATMELKTKGVSSGGEPGSPDIQEDLHGTSSPSRTSFDHPTWS